MASDLAIHERVFGLWNSISTPCEEGHERMPVDPVHPFYFARSFTGIFTGGSFNVPLQAAGWSPSLGGSAAKVPLKVYSPGR